MFYDENGNPDHSDESEQFYNMLGQTAQAAASTSYKGAQQGQAGAQKKNQNGGASDFQWGPSTDSGGGGGMGSWGP